MPSPSGAAAIGSAQLTERQQQDGNPKQ